MLQTIRGCGISDRTVKRPAFVLPIVLLALLSSAAMVAQAGSVPHLHAAAQAGLYNQEHDLTLLAGLAGHGLLLDTAPALTTDVVSSFLPVLAPERPALRLTRSSDSRAPPTA